MASWVSRRLAFIVSVLALASLTIAAPAAAPATESSSSPEGSTVIQLRIDGEIEPILAEYLINGIQQANRDHATLILVTINTPGGLDTSMRSIIQAILTSPVPVVLYVSPTGSRAASAGFFILLSADVAAMSPGTDTGAASPIMEMFAQPENSERSDCLPAQLCQQTRPQYRACGHGGDRRKSVQRKGSARRKADRSGRLVS
jgi:membrane-bound ClpP family serine protease